MDEDLEQEFNSLDAQRNLCESEYAPEFPDSQIIYVNPPDFFEPVANTQKIILPSHDTREFLFKTVRQ